ncbi:hypothetical protein NLI96_g8320 [Meripilus lineatus]|uniref:Uncharacterized protein n=1 Tax=Meripilus lineatus TaxID=2056292 RepID=A0AAD5V263_9APHY|nr:hypothetical protein NLI96_g8320 [Physisporinus lineatus]
MQTHRPLPPLNLDVLSNVLAYFEKSEDVSSFMLACRAFYGLSIPHFLDPKRKGVELKNEKDALLFMTFMSAPSHSDRRFGTLSDLCIKIDFHPQSKDFVNQDNRRVIGRRLADIIHRSVNLKGLSFNDSILELGDPKIYQVFRDLKSHRRLQRFNIFVAEESGCQLLEEIEASPVVDLSIRFHEYITMGPEILSPFASTVTCLRIELPTIYGLRDVCCPRVRELSLSTSGNIVTVDLLRAFPRLQDFILEDVGDCPFPPPLVNDTRALHRRADNQSLLVRDNITALRLRYVEGPPTWMYMLGLLPGVREIDLSGFAFLDDGGLKHAIQAVRDCSPKAVRIEIRKGRQETSQEAKDMLQELTEILKASGTTHLFIVFELTGQALLASMASTLVVYTHYLVLSSLIEQNTLACILSKFTSLKYLVVHIHYHGYSSNSIILEPHALDAPRTQDAVERGLNVGLLRCMADEIAKGIPSLKQIGIDCECSRGGPQGYWEVFRRGDKRGDVDVRWLTLVTLPQYEGGSAGLRFWGAAKAEDASLRPNNCVFE